MPSKRFHAVVHGRVQGVFFRASVRDTAVRLGLKGFARNLSDGTVEVVAEGSAKKLEELASFLYRGPPAAKVEKIELSWQEPKSEFGSFSVRY